MNREELENKAYAVLEMKRRRIEARNQRKTIYGIVDMNKEVIRKYQNFNGTFKEVESDYVDVLVPERQEPFLIKKKLIKILIGGRGSGKTFTGGDVAIGLSRDMGYKFACFRQFQNSTSDSTYSLLKDEISRLGYNDFSVQQHGISHKNGSSFIFRGLDKNTESVKSMQGFNRFLIDEAQAVSQEAFDVLMPTIRESDSEVWMFANPKSSGDAFSQNYLVPFQKELDRDGYYEDDMHLIIVCNYMHNPFFPEALELQRKKAKETKSTSYYDHIWLGKYSDEVEDAIIEPEWFDACIDAHKNEVFRKSMIKKGAIISSHDVADTGDDDKAYACRHGSVITKVCSKANGDISDGAQWAIRLANEDDCDVFTFDASGMGVGIRKEVNEAFEGKKIIVDEHKGANEPDNPNKYYDDIDKRNKRTNKETFKNKRAQYLWYLRDRVYNTYRVVVKGEYVDPELCISFDSEGIENMEKLRSEVCRQPLKDNANGLIQMMSKKEMKKLGIPSPNMLDAIAMTMIVPKELVKKSRRSKRKLKIKRISMV